VLSFRAVPRSVRWAVAVGLIGADQERTGLMDIRAAELTADHLGRSIQIDPAIKASSSVA
jgi:hypothetical protein